MVLVQVQHVVVRAREFFWIDDTFSAPHFDLTIGIHDFDQKALGVRTVRLKALKRVDKNEKFGKILSEVW